MRFNLQWGDDGIEANSHHKRLSRPNSIAFDNFRALRVIRIILLRSCASNFASALKLSCPRGAVPCDLLTDWRLNLWRGHQCLKCLNVAPVGNYWRLISPMVALDTELATQLAIRFVSSFICEILRASWHAHALQTLWNLYYHIIDSWKCSTALRAGDAECNICHVPFHLNAARK